MDTLRIGLGYDIHRMLAGRPLVLANITIPHAKGLDGHSDADVVIHALIDALTGAAGLPDVGQLFPNSDLKYRGIDSARLLKETRTAFEMAGFQLVNADIVVHAQQPKLAPYKPAMIQRLAELLGVDQTCINIKGKTGEGIGVIGKGKAISCQCVVLVRRK